jgi:hypothetical protein
MVTRDDHLGGTNLGTVAVGTDSDNRLQNNQQAIKALESVRDGRREAGHGDGP